jgi:transcriptional regulator with XRE-family HTH domain
MEQRTPRNAVGAVVRRLRTGRGWTQEAFAAKLQVAGCPVSRGTLAKIEARIRIVTDVELFAMAQVLGVEMPTLFPRDFVGHLKRHGWSG